MEWCKKPLRKKSKRNHCVSLFIDKNNAIYFDSFGIEYFPQEVLKKNKEKIGTHNIFRIQDGDSINFGFSCIAFIELWLQQKRY